MDLHGIVSGAIGTVNPHVPATLRVSTGSTLGADGSRTPTFTDYRVTAQVQQLTTRDLMHLDSLNVQGSQRSIYLRGSAEAAVRVSQRGGDLVVLADGTWLVTAVLERWPDWCKVSATLQND